MAPTETEVPQSILKIGETTANKISQNIDYKNPIVKDYARAQITESNKGNYSIKQVFDIWDSINNSWTYVGYPDEYTYYSNASDLITGGLRGNCVNFAILTSALIESIGGKTRVVKTIGPEGIWHVYPEVFIGTSRREIQPVISYVKKRYSTKKAYYHEEVAFQGVKNYWLNLDNWQKKPGDPLFDDYGVYHVYYPNGNFTSFSDSGYSANFPPFPPPSNVSNPIVISRTTVTISYRTYKSYSFHRLANEPITIEIMTDKASVNVFIIEQDNFNKFKEITKGLQTPFSGWHCLNVNHRVFNFIPASDGIYYLILGNAQFSRYSADTKTDVNVSINATIPLINQ